jgi:hypothetical protein
MKSYGIVLIAMLTMLTMLLGCSSITQQTPSLKSNVQRTMERAQYNLEVIEQLQVQERYGRDFREAQNELISAEQYVQENHHDQAYIAALNSLAATQRIFRQIYQERTSLEAKQEIRTIMLDDPDNPLRDFLPLLHELLDYADKIESGRKAIDFTQILDDLENIASISDEARGMSKMLVAEVAFGPGNYVISEIEKYALSNFAQALITEKEAFEKLYPARRFVVKTKVVGYADQLDFREETTFLALLPVDVAAQLPQHPIERRQFLNLWLSEFRAESISRQLRERLLQTAPEMSPSQTNQESMGLGEEIPPEVSPPYPIQDPRRRICKIYGYITVP